MTVEDQRVANDGLGETLGQCLGVFYANDGMVGSQEADWLQHSMNVLVDLLRQYGLAANVSKSHILTDRTGGIVSGSWNNNPNQSSKAKQLLP